ncbi:MAG TPA: aminoacetone oxidase family FAD-binding enzyme [Terriglobales bacterium]|nr:aminoacetone oxidase family FAD-binding enzyme [Terriglobales bacterium]
MQCDCVVVGAGAAGLSAAIFAAQAGARVHVLEGAAKVGAKILISGGGRCNVTNAAVSPRDFNGRQPVVRNILAAFDEHAARAWFESLGVQLKTEQHGKLFPVTDSARTVVDALLRRCAELNVDIVTKWRLAAIERIAEGFRLHPTDGEAIVCRRLVLATGGRSLPRTGSDGHGWQVVRGLGHTVTPTFPALVPLVLRADFFHGSLSGLSHLVELSTFASGKLADRRCGSLLFTHFGISGPVVLDASRHYLFASFAQGGSAVDAKDCEAEGTTESSTTPPEGGDRSVPPRSSTFAKATVDKPERSYMAGHVARLGTPPRSTEPSSIVCNFFPGNDAAAIDARLVAASRAHPRQRPPSYLEGLLPARLAAALGDYAGVAATPLAELSKAHRRKLVQVLAALELPVERARGWDFAEVTAGGVPLDEIDYRTMQSRKTPGLYLIGEMLDCDGRIGGFNFQWAWSTGYLAGNAIAAL